MSSSNNCPDCGGHDGNHYNDCVYDGTNGNSSLGGGGGEKLLFATFCVIGIIVGVLCPPLGAVVVIIGANIAGV